MAVETGMSTYVKGFHDETALKDMTYQPLGNTGLHISKLAYGSSGIAFFQPTEESVAVVTEALKKGINYIDTAPWYGNGKSETVLGMVFKTVPRECFYIATKVGRYEPEFDKMFDFSAERIKKSIDESLNRMGLDYVDILQVHDMEFAPNLDIIINETLPALQEIKDSGKARFIGITGYPLENFKTVLEKSKVKIDTVLSYCRGCMHDSSILDYISYFKTKGVGIMNAAPIGMGLYCEAGPRDWHPGQPKLKEACGQVIQYCKENGVDVSRLAMKHSLDLPDIVTTIVGCESSKILNNNLNVLKSPLTELEVQTYNDVMTKFMKPLKNMNWEGIEVQNYWKQIAKLQS